MVLFLSTEGTDDRIKIYKQKKKVSAFVKCAECSTFLDDNEEKILWKCKQCGKVHSGTLNYYVCQPKDTAGGGEYVVPNKIAVEKNDKKRAAGVNVEHVNSLTMNKTICIYPRNRMKSEILPTRIERNSNIPILPKHIGKKYDIKFHNSGGVLFAGVALFIFIVGIYGYRYQDFKSSFERDWKRTESSGDSYYELQLEIEEGNIEYSFDSWLISTRIGSFEYSILAPGKVKINDRQIYDVKIKDDVMRIEPSLTSSDSYELWFK